MTKSKVKVKLPKRIPVADIGPGIDITVSDGDRVLKPLTVTFAAVAPGEGLVPAVAHHRDDGSWELKEVTSGQPFPDVTIWGGSGASV